MRTDAGDYTQPVEAVAYGELRRRDPHTAGDREELFREWCRRNPEALREMELTAVAIDARGRRVSAKYLVERQRYEGRARLVAVPYEGPLGQRLEYSINNSDTALLARWLLARHPGMAIETRRSRFDAGEDGGGS